MVYVHIIYFKNGLEVRKETLDRYNCMRDYTPPQIFTKGNVEGFTSTKGKRNPHRDVRSVN